MKKRVINEDFHCFNVDETIKKLESNRNGLSKEAATIRQEKYGKNELSAKKGTSALTVFFKQFRSFFVYILIFAAVISYFVEHKVDMYVIITVIIINTVIGFYQEYKAEKAIEALKKIIVPYAKVYRKGELLSLPASELVPGDIIILEEGDRIPADARLIELNNFSTNEASLTGESLPISKDNALMGKETVLADRKNMIWMGTFVSTGTAKAIVVATGDGTALGAIATDIGKIKTEKSHFQKKTDVLAMQMGLIAIFGSALIFFIGFVFRGFGFIEILMFTIAALVAAIPEGLPAVLIIVLAIGAFRMSKRKAIIRNLPATETLAVVNTIITDKTGTLTENTMTVRKILLPGEKDIDVGGGGWEAIGEISQNKRSLVALEKGNLKRLVHIAGICNNAAIIKEQQKDEITYKIIGDPTEAALNVLSEKAGLKHHALIQSEKKIDDYPFNPNLKFRASLAYLPRQKKKYIYAVGAPEVILQRSSRVRKLNTKKRITSFDLKEIEKQIFSLTNNAMRTLAIAYKEVSVEHEKILEENVNDLVYLGVLGITDPPREGVKEALDKAQLAGIRVIMATGDHKNTALAIAKEIGLKINTKSRFHGALTEEELKKLNKNDFKEAVKTVNIFARLTPHMKLKIADVLQKQGDVIAMTGDGVNDAPALKKADIGIAMGLIGTDVARESAKIILADDNFASIINAIEEGRIVYTNTKQTSFFLITTNFAEQITLLASLVCGLPLPLTPTQILWLNLVTDTGQGIGLAAEPGHDGITERKPENSKENILSKEIIPYILTMSLCMVALALGAFLFFLDHGIEKARSAAFVIMTMTQLFNSINMRSLKKSVFGIGLFSNRYFNWFLALSVFLMLAVIYIPFLQNAFNFDVLGLSEIFVLLVASSSVLWIGEALKTYQFKKKGYSKHKDKSFNSSKVLNP